MNVRSNDSDSDDSDEEHEKSLKRRLPNELQNAKEMRTQSEQDIALSRLLSGNREEEHNNNDSDGNESEQNDENNNPNIGHDEEFEAETNDYNGGSISHNTERFVTQSSLRRAPFSKEALRLKSYNNSPPDSNLKENQSRTGRSNNR